MSQDSHPEGHPDDEIEVPSPEEMVILQNTAEVMKSPDLRELIQTAASQVIAVVEKYEHSDEEIKSLAKELAIELREVHFVALRRYRLIAEVSGMLAVLFGQGVRMGIEAEVSGQLDDEDDEDDDLEDDEDNNVT